MHRMVCQFKVRHEFAIAKKTCPHASTNRKDQLESVAFDRGESLHVSAVGILVLLSDRPILELLRVQLLICDITIYRLSAELRPLS